MTKVRRPPKKVDPAVGQRIKEARETLGMTQEKLAAEAGGKVRGIQNNEAGIAMPNSRVVAALSARGINANWLLTGKGEKLSPSSTSREARVDQVVNQVMADYVVESMLDVVIEAVESSPGAAQLTPKEKAAVVSGALKVFRSLPDGEREKGATPIVMAIMNRLLELPPAREVSTKAGQEWPLVERRQVIRRKADEK